jgi:hypothetical protein
MNKRGQLIFYGMMMGIAIIVMALALAPTIKTFSDGARNETDVIGGQGLNCTSSLINDYDKGACILVDLINPYFIGALICIAVIIITAKFIFQ